MWPAAYRPAALICRSRRGVDAGGRTCGHNDKERKEEPTSQDGRAQMLWPSLQIIRATCQLKSTHQVSHCNLTSVSAKLEGQEVRLRGAPAGSSSRATVRHAALRRSPWPPGCVPGRCPRARHACVPRRIAGVGRVLARLLRPAARALEQPRVLAPARDCEHLPQRHGPPRPPPGPAARVCPAGREREGHGRRASARATRSGDTVKARL